MLQAIGTACARSIKSWINPLLHTSIAPCRCHNLGGSLEILVEFIRPGAINLGAQPRCSNPGLLARQNCPKEILQKSRDTVDKGDILEHQSMFFVHVDSRVGPGTKNDADERKFNMLAPRGTWLCQRSATKAGLDLSLVRPSM